MIFPSEPPTSADLMRVVDLLRDIAVGIPVDVSDVADVTGTACLRVAGALEALAPFAKSLEDSPGNLAPMVQLLLQATTTEGSGNAASSEGPDNPQAG